MLSDTKVYRYIMCGVQLLWQKKERLLLILLGSWIACVTHSRSSMSRVSQHRSVGCSPGSNNTCVSIYMNINTSPERTNARKHGRFRPNQRLVIQMICGSFREARCPPHDNVQSAHRPCDEKCKDLSKSNCASRSTPRFLFLFLFFFTERVNLLFLCNHTPWLLEATIWNKTRKWHHQRWFKLLRATSLLKVNTILVKETANEELQNGLFFRNGRVGQCHCSARQNYRCKYHTNI